MLPTAEGEEEEPEDPQEGEKPLREYIDDDDITIDPESDSTWIPLSEPERLGLLASYRHEVEEEIPYKYGRLLLEILRSESDPTEVPRVQRVLREYLEALVAAGRFEILRRIESGLSGAEPDLEPTRLALRATRRFFEEPAVYVRAAELGAHSHEGDRAAALAFLERIPHAVFAEVTSLLMDERAEPNPEALEKVRQRLRADVDARRACLEDARRPVQRFALEQDGPLDEAGSRKIRDLLKDPEPALRELAARALGGAQGGPALGALGEALVDPESTVRVAAAESLGRVGGSKALELLLRVVVAREFSHRGLSEKRAVFLAAGQVAPDEVVPVLARLAEYRSLWRSREKTERGEAALEALGNIGERVRPALEARWKRKRPDLLRRFESQLRHSGADGSEAAA
ncbi:MAG: HEAT repeat domain-containing protein [Candidatus Eisenbacteria bacterium]